LLASAKAFSAFFALTSAALYDFSAFTLAAVATSKAFREALSSASSDAMRALADAKASTAQQGREKSNKQQREEYKTSKDRTKESTFGSFRNLQILSTLSTQGDEFFHQCLARE
jgi:hypothetical protein